MTTPSIEEMVEEFDQLSRTHVDQGGWSIPYEGIYTPKQRDWLTTTLTQAHQGGRDEAVEIVKKEQVLNYGRAEWVSKDNLLQALQGNK